MAGAERVVVGREDAAVLEPVGSVEEIAAGVFQKAEAVMRSPGTAGGIDDKRAAVALEDLWTFADGHGVALPCFVGGGEECAWGGELARVFHLRDVEVLASVAIAGPAGPDEEAIAGAGGEGGSVDRPALGVEGTDQRIVAGGIVAEGAEDPHAMVGVVAVVGGEIDVVASVDAVEFGSPEIA